MLCALSAVDAVVGFSEDTPAQLMEQLKPDIFVKGGDYKLEQLREARYAGRTVLISLKKGYSTTNIARKLREVRA